MTSNLAIIRRDWSQPVAELRSSLENPQTPLSYPAEWLLDMFNGGRTDSGIRVSEQTAFQVITFLAGVDLIGTMVSSQPWHTVERTFNKHGRAVHRIAYEHDYYEMLSEQPNEEMTWQIFLYAYLCHMMAWPAAYAEVQRDGGMDAVAIWPRNPAKTRPIRVSHSMVLEPVPWRPYPVVLRAQQLAYETTDGAEEGSSARMKRIIPAEDMLHVPGLALDGRMGQSVVSLARNTLGAILAMEKFGNRYFANFARPGGILNMPAKTSKADEDKSKQSWQEAMGGENSNSVAVMPPGWSWQSVAHDPQQAQTREQREYLRTDIAALLHLPPRVLGDTSTKTRGSTEQENQEILDFALAPKISAIKQEFRRKLFPHAGVGRPKNPYLLDCDTWRLVRGDAASREKFYSSGKQWGFLNTNDIKSREGENPVDEPWAEEYWMPVNMTLVTTPVDPSCDHGAPSPDLQVYSRLFRDAFGRIVAREKRDAHALQACFGAVCHAMRDQFGAAASREMRVQASPGAESERFVGEYLAGLSKRAAEWTAERADEVCEAELARAARAIRVAVYREIAAEKAKEPALVG